MDEIRNKDGLTLAEFLTAYDPNRYEHPSVTVDMAVFTLKRVQGAEAGFKLAVLLIRRGDHPQIGRHALPGGFVDMDEDTLAAAARELSEETGISGLPLRQFATFGAVDRDVRTRVITVGHYALAPYTSLKFAAGDDAADAELFTVDVDLLAACASAETYELTLRSERETLKARCKLRYDELGSHTEPIKGGDLAGDHAHILFSALCAINELPRRRAARLLALGAPEGEACAMDALDEALAAIPDRF